MIALFSTKLHRPALRSDALHRAHLISRLNSAHPLTLLSAPAGFGKTTLVSAWSAQTAARVGWLALEAADNEFPRFLTYLIAALRTVSATKLGEGVLALLPAPQPAPPAALVAALADELLATLAPCVLVLDDYHVISAQPIHAAISFLLEHVPALRWVITTRADPPLPLGRLRARQQLLELRAADLRFSRAETTHLLNEIRQLGLPAEAVQALAMRTEGWVAGLQLAALAMQQTAERSAFVQSFSGNHRYIVDYLTDEVLSQLPEATQRFLLQTSLLDRLCAELCDAVIGEQERGAVDGLAAHLTSINAWLLVPDPPAPLPGLTSQVILEALERANLFLSPLDEERRWYRYHQLFADLLRQRLHRRLPAQAPLLHQRAAAWFEAHELWEEAMHHAAQGQDYSRMIRLIEQHALFLGFNAQAALLQNWLQWLPVTLRQSTPRLCLAQVWVGISLGNLPLVEPALRAAAQLLDQQPALASTALQTELAIAHTMIASTTLDVKRALYYGQLALANLPQTQLRYRLFVAWGLGHAQMWAGQVAAAEQTLTQALRASPEEASFLVSKVTLLGTLGLLRTIQGRYQDAQALYRQAIELTSRAGRPLPMMGVGLVYLELGQRLYEENRLDEAEQFLQQALTLAQTTENNIIQAHALSNLGLIACARGQQDQVWSLLDQADQIANAFAVPSFLVNEIHRVFLWLKYGQWQAAATWATTYAASLDPARPLTFLDLGQIALARVWIYLARYAEAHVLLARLHTEAEATGQGSFSYWALILRTVAFYGQGEQAQAQATLLAALQRTEPEKIVRMFVGEGEAIRQTLQALRQTVVAPRLQIYMAHILAAFDEQGPAAQPATAAAPHAKRLVPRKALIEPLSDREREILQLIAAGLSNQEIADRLVITLGTVKSHANHIFGKLGVQGRVKAVNVAREAGLL